MFNKLNSFVKFDSFIKFDNIIIQFIIMFI